MSPMRPRTVVALVAVALVALVLLLLWLPGRRASSAVAGRVQQASELRTSSVAGPRPLLQRPAVRLVAPSPGGQPAAAPAGAFEGRVISALTGRGLPGAQLTFSSGQGTSSASAGAEGDFRFDALRAGRWWLAAVTAPGHQPFAPEWGQSPVQLDARPGVVVRGVTIALLPAEPYLGRVVGPKDEPVEGASVTVLGGGQGQVALVPLPDRYRTGADGSFGFTAPEEAVLEVRHPGFSTGRVRVDYAVRVSRKVTIRLTPLGGPVAALAIEGTVEDPTGQPAEGAVVSAASRLDPDAPPALARTDAQGRFRVGDLASGSWALTATMPGAAPAQAQADAGATGIRLRLTVGGRLEGRVSDRGSGAPVMVFTVLVQGAASRAASIVDAEGRFELDGLVPGEALVTVLAPGHAPSSELRVVIPGSGSGPARLDVTLGRGGRVTGRVVERGSGTAVGGARVEIEGSPSSSGVPIRNETLSAEDGRFTLDAVAENAVGLFVSAVGHHARVIACPPVREGETVGPIEIDLGAVAPGQDPRVELVGIGAGLEKKGAVLRITMVVPTGGAAEAGLGPGDEVLSIDGASVEPMSLQDAIPRIRGPEGSFITLVVVKAGDAARSGLTVRVPRRLVRT
jgi:hypothetical protein